MDDNDDLLTIEDATHEFRVSRKTIRRRLADGAVEGAHKREGPRGPEWVFPRESITALGFAPREPSAPDRAARPRPGRGSEQRTDAVRARSVAVAPGNGRQRRSGRLLVALGVVLLVGVIGGTIALLAADDDETAPGRDDAVTTALDELTDRGEQIGFVGASAGALLPARRAPVEILDLDDLAAGPRIVVADVAAPQAEPTVLAELERTSTVVLALPRADGEFRIYDRATPPAETTTTVSARPESAVPPEPGPAPEPDPAPATDDDPAKARVVTVTAGDHFWGLAEAELTRVLDRAPSEADVASYWSQVLAANQDRLIEPGNPDLIHVGQQVLMPAVR